MATRSRRPSPRRAFTLIELMIVVAIMGILAAVVAPMIIARAQRTSSPSTGRAAKEITQAPPALAAFAGEREVAPPKTRSSDVRVHLSYGPVLVGQDVRSRYVASFRGAFEVESAAPDADTMTLRFPFPPDMAEARGVSLRFRNEHGVMVEPPGVEYGLDGIRWRGHVTPGEVIAAEVAYEVIGQDAFTYGVAAGGRTGKVRVRIDVEGPGEPTVPASSLAPTSIDRGHLEWEVTELVANRPIVVELPPGSSPLGRLILLLRYAALAVLGFGAGFWYLSERHSPGRMDAFRFPHFLLLALNYGLFFAVLAVLLSWLSFPIALLLAFLASLPLLALHVARILDASFALKSAVPLAVYTLGTVTAAVYFEAQRPLVFLASAVAALGHVTFTHKSWDAGRRGHRVQKTSADQLSVRALAAEAALAKVTAELETERAKVRVVEKKEPHCVACGVRVDPSAHFCAACGAERPRVRPCSSCGAVLRLPPKMLRRSWSTVPACCESCGDALA